METKDLDQTATWEGRRRRGLLGRELIRELARQGLVGQLLGQGRVLRRGRRRRAVLRQGARQKSTVVMMRHGESTWNLENKFTGAARRAEQKRPSSA